MVVIAPFASGSSRSIILHFSLIRNVYRHFTGQFWGEKVVKSNSKDLKMHNTIAYTVTHTVAHPLRLPVPACEHLHKFAVDI